jgi:hypothetical protein
MNVPYTHQVLLIITDISGYTKFMVSSDVEIKHSQHVISELIQAIIREVKIPLEVSKLEGDAVFLYVKKDNERFTLDNIRKITGEKLFRFFEVFHEKLHEQARHTRCNCGACSNVLALRLKVVVHSGEALFYQIHHFNELSGKDVILVHRLLKKSESNEEYLLLTERAYIDIQFPRKVPVREGSETYQHLGQFRTFVCYPYTGIA